MTRHRSTTEISTLKKARRAFFSRNNTSDTESSEASIESQENSHIPLRKDIPSIANLFLEEHEKMEQLPAQLQQIMQQLSNISARQDRYEQQLNANRGNEIEQSDLEEEIIDLGPSNAQNVMESLSRIPDPIKSIPSFDGNPKQLNAWVISAENTLKIFKPLVPANVFAIYEQSVIHKLQGRAKDAICMAQYPQTFAEAKQILTSVLGDRQELSSYKSKLWRNKQNESMSVHKYYQKTQYLVERIKTLAKQDKDYASSWPAISKFIEQDALAAFVAGLNEFYFGHALAARPKSLEDAYAFLCEFTSSEKIARAEKKTENTNRQPRDQQYKKHNKDNNHKKDDKQLSEPMEVDPSIRSRMTLNKRNVNTHEVDDSETDSEKEDENDCDVNFQQATSLENPE